MLVVDASAVVELLLRTALGHAVADAIRADHTLHAPELLGIEVTSVLRALIRTKEIDASVAEQALSDLRALGIECYEHLPLLPRVLSLRDNLTAYDAVYVALAEGVGAPLLTCDTKVASAPGHRAEVLLVGLPIS